MKQIKFASLFIISQLCAGQQVYWSYLNIPFDSKAPIVRLETEPVTFKKLPRFISSEYPDYEIYSFSDGQKVFKARDISKIDKNLQVSSLWLVRPPETWTTKDLHFMGLTYPSNFFNEIIQAHLRFGRVETNPVTQMPGLWSGEIDNDKPVGYGTFARSNNEDLLVFEGLIKDGVLCGKVMVYDRKHIITHNYEYGKLHRTSEYRLLYPENHLHTIKLHFLKGVQVGDGDGYDEYGKLIMTFSKGRDNKYTSKPTKYYEERLAKDRILNAFLWGISLEMISESLTPKKILLNCLCKVCISGTAAYIEGVYGKCVQCGGDEDLCN